jgi:triosephosphate isomerase
MNRGSPSEAVEMLYKLIPLVKDITSVDIVVTPPFTALLAALQTVKNTNIRVGAQNMYFEDSGAFTGEISPVFLKDLGCNYVILGHSERRDIFNERDDLINKKLKKALVSDLIPIVCIGEHLEEREAGRTKEIIEDQFKNTFKDLNSEEMGSVVVAYEPIWAIGTGKTATPDQAEEIHIFIRELIADIYGKSTAETVRIQYGGSIKPANAKEIFKKKNIDGGLVGGASLQSNSFYEIIKAAEESVK